MQKYIDVQFISDSTTRSLYQYDRGLQLHVIKPGNRQFVIGEVQGHFTCEGTNVSINVVPVVEQDYISVQIPNVLLMQPNTIFCYLYIVNATNNYGYTESKITIPVIARVKPADVVYSEQQLHQFNALLAQFNKAYDNTKQLQDNVQSVVGRAQTLHDQLITIKTSIQQTKQQADQAIIDINDATQRTNEIIITANAAVANVNSTINRTQQAVSDANEAVETAKNAANSIGNALNELNSATSAANEAAEAATEATQRFNDILEDATNATTSANEAADRANNVSASLQGVLEGVLATETTAGLMSAQDKKTLNSIDEIINNELDNVVKTVNGFSPTEGNVSIVGQESPTTISDTSFAGTSMKVSRADHIHKIDQLNNDIRNSYFLDDPLPQDEISVGQVVAQLAENIEAIRSQIQNAEFDSLKEEILYIDDTDVDEIDVVEKAEFDSLKEDIASKQDAISDLDEIRDGASKGATALQSIPVAGTEYGLVKVNSNKGIYLSNGELAINTATANQIDAKSSNLRPITPYNIDRAVRDGLVSNSQITDADKASIRQTIGIVTTTQEEYDLLDAPNESTIYLIVG